MNRIDTKMRDPVRVIRATWDGSLDYWLERMRAEELYRECKLHKDVTNGCYGSNVRAGKILEDDMDPRERYAMIPGDKVV